MVMLDGYPGDRAAEEAAAAGAHFDPNAFPADWRSWGSQSSEDRIRITC